MQGLRVLCSILLFGFAVPGSAAGADRVATTAIGFFLNNKTQACGLGVKCCGQAAQSHGALTSIISFASKHARAFTTTSDPKTVSGPAYRLDISDGLGVAGYRCRQVCHRLSAERAPNVTAAPFKNSFMRNLPKILNKAKSLINIAKHPVRGAR